MFFYSFSTMYSSHRRRNLQFNISISILLLAIASRIQSAHGGVIKREIVQSANNFNETSETDVTELGNVTTLKTTSDVTEAINVKSSTVFTGRPTVKTKETTIVTDIQVTPTTTESSKLEVDDDHIVKSLEKLELGKIPKTTLNVRQSAENLVDITTTTPKRSFRATPKESATESSGLEVTKSTTTTQSQVEVNQIEQQQFKATTSKSHQNSIAATTPAIESEDTTRDDSLRFDINEYTNHPNPVTTVPLDTHDKLSEDRFYGTDYEKEFNELKLTTPASYYDFVSSSSNNIHDDNDVLDKIKEHDSTKNNEKFDFDDDIKANSTIETNTSVLVDQSEIESTNYDIATNEIKNFTFDKNPHLVFSEVKSNKFNETKLEIHPLRAKLDSFVDTVSNSENTKETSGTFVNETSETSEPHDSVTARTKQESSWTGKSVDSESVRYNHNDSFSSDSITLSPNSIENALEADKVPKTREKHKSEQLLQENKVIPVVVAAPTTPSSDENIINESEVTSTISNSVDENTSLIEKGNNVEDVEVVDISTKRDYNKLGKYIEPASDSNNITEAKNLVETTTKQKRFEQETTEPKSSETTNLEVTTQSFGISHSSRDETYSISKTTTTKPTTILFPSIYAKTSDEITSIYKGDWPSTTIFSARKPKTTEGKPKTIELPSESSTSKNLEDPKTTEFVEKIPETTIKEEVNGTSIISEITDDGTTISAISESTTQNLVGEGSTVGSLATSEVETTDNISTLKTTDNTTSEDTTTETEVEDTTDNSTVKETTSKVDIADTTLKSNESEQVTSEKTDDITNVSTVKDTTTEIDPGQNTLGARDKEEITTIESHTKVNTKVDETTLRAPKTTTFKTKTESTSDLSTTTEVEESTPALKQTEETTLKQKEETTTSQSFDEKTENKTEEIEETTLNIKKSTVTEEEPLDRTTVTTPENLFETTTLQIIRISVTTSSDPSETTTDSHVDNTTITSPSASENEIRETEKSTKVDTTTKIPDLDISTEETIASQSTTESVITFESYTAQSVDRQTTLGTTEQTTSHTTKITPIATTEEPSTSSTTEHETTTESTDDDSSIEANVIDRTSTSSPKEPESTSSTTESTMATVVTRITTETNRNGSDEQATTAYSTTTQSSYIIPTKRIISSTTSSELQNTESVDSSPPEDTDYNVIIAVSVSVVAIIILVLLAGFFYVMRKRQKQITYGQRCRPVSLDAYSLDNVSVFNSVRRKGALRASKRTYGNAAFDDPSLKHNVLTAQAIGKFLENKTGIREEFSDVPQVIARADEVPPGCEDKNRYANVIPLPETRVILEQQNGDEKTEYINANFVRGPKDEPNYYIACQAPLESTVGDFWRMIWEQNSRVIIMATDLIENGIEKCAEYLPASMTLDDHTVYGDFQITLKNREVKEKYAVSTLHVKNMLSNTWREVTHFWYQWPETGVPGDESSVIAMLLEARTYLKSSMPDQNENDDNKSEEKHQNGKITNDVNGATDKPKVTTTSTKTQGPLTVHCSPGTGRTGTIIACDIAIRCLELPKRSVDVPQIVYFVRRGRASSVQTKEQYEFIYRVANAYATKLMGPINDN